MRISEVNKLNPLDTVIIDGDRYRVDYRTDKYFQLVDGENVSAKLMGKVSEEWFKRKFSSYSCRMNPNLWIKPYSESEMIAFKYSFHLKHLLAHMHESGYSIEVIPFDPIKEQEIPNNNNKKEENEYDKKLHRQNLNVTEETGRGGKTVSSERSFAGFANQYLRAREKYIK